MPTPVLMMDALQKESLDAGFAAAFGGAPERYFSAPGRTESNVRNCKTTGLAGGKCLKMDMPVV